MKIILLTILVAAVSVVHCGKVDTAFENDIRKGAERMIAGVKAGKYGDTCGKNHEIESKWMDKLPVAAEFLNNMICKKKSFSRANEKGKECMSCIEKCFYTKAN